MYKETSAADKMKAVYILDLMKALLICKSTISIIINHISVAFLYFHSFIYILTIISCFTPTISDSLMKVKIKGPKNVKVYKMGVVVQKLREGGAPRGRGEAAIVHCDGARGYIAIAIASYHF